MYSFLVARTDPEPRTRIEEIIACIKSSEEYTEPTQGRLEAILKSMSKGEEYTEETYSRIEALFKEWVNKAI
jgi:tyrosyl-tRNA synthetase